MSRCSTTLFCVLCLAGCKLPCLGSVSCCQSCDDDIHRENVCACTDDESIAHLCPKRSRCALDFYVGEGPADCCSDCDAAHYLADGRTCNDQDVFLHECPVESSCFQTYQASLIQARYLPFKTESATVGGRLVSAWGDAVGNTWVVGTTGRILRRDAQGGWSSIDSGISEDLNAIWGSDETLWAVGNNGLILRRRAGKWSKVDPVTEHHLFALWAEGDHLWAVGHFGTVLRYDRDASRWRVQDVPTQAHLMGAWSSGRDFWAVGERGTILHQNGSKWSLEASPAGQAHLTGVWGASVSRVLAVGFGGVLLERIDGEWNRLVSPVREHILGITGSGGEGDFGAWAVGRRGVILEFDSTSLSWGRGSYFVDNEPRDLFGIWANSEKICVVGDRGTILYLER